MKLPPFPVLPKLRMRTTQGSGLVLGFVAYSLWGLFPLYFHLLQGMSPVEVVANRVVWSLVFLVFLTGVRGSWPSTRASMRPLRKAALLALAAAFIALNWLVYVYAVVTGQVVEASLGYFITPLVVVGLGVTVLRERLRPGQWAAVGIAVFAVLVLSVSYGRLPWISLVLACSFSLYGLIKKQAGVGAMESLTIETAALAPAALATMAWFAATGQSALVSGDVRSTVLLALLGPVTAIPLLAFGAAARRISLSTLGLLQYLTPVIQFLIGVLALGEAMPPSRWIGFFLVWTSLVVMTADGLSHVRTPVDGLEVIEPD